MMMMSSCLSPPAKKKKKKRVLFQEWWKMNDTLSCHSGIVWEMIASDESSTGERKCKCPRWTRRRRRRACRLRDHGVPILNVITPDSLVPCTTNFITIEKGRARKSAAHSCLRTSPACPPFIPLIGCIKAGGRKKRKLVGIDWPVRGGSIL